MGKKEGQQQGDEESQGLCRRCLNLFQCCHIPAATGVKIVSIVSILIGLVFCCLGVWTIIVTSNNIELPPRNQVMYELPQPTSPPPSSSSSSNGFNGSPALSVYNAVLSSRDQDTISTQSSLLDTSSISLSSSSYQNGGNDSGNFGSSTGTGNGASSSDWPLSSVSTGKGPSGRRPPFLSQQGPKKLIPLSNYHNYLICLGILSICVGFMRTLTSTFLLWNSVEKHSKTPGAVWIFANILGTIGILVFLGVTLNVTGFINDFPWRANSITVKNDRFNFYLLLIMFRILCICDIFLTFDFVLVVLWFVRTIN